ncbi:3-deoxy-D-manno-octulosonic acid transferase [Flagellimonas sp.]|uniref:3-deoxy-D-manno-octulosonic acid transferase n=1 Tax=Flagellimonas sp. TaxID=2058762 RepID=UPI003B510EED
MISVRALYNILQYLAWMVLHVVAIFNTKINQFVKGRKQTRVVLSTNPLAGEKVIWMHVASLGEYEQGLPILEKIRENHPYYKIVLTFFSPSGYEVKKNSTPADLVLYLPMDTHFNAKKFLNTLKPKLAIFIKYEIWPNYLHELKRREIPTLLVSAIFSKRQVFLKWYGGFMRKSLSAFEHFFVQNETSKELLKSIGHENVSICGDTRFDRVSKIMEQDNRLDFMEKFKNGGLCFVAGSTWPEDEEILVEFIDTTDFPIKFVIAPHNIKSVHIDKLKNSINKKVIQFSEMGNTTLSHFDVLIVDTIGLLTKIYSYADVSYVGGAFATGLHNTLEPATFGIPIIIGPKYEGFKEAEDLVDKKGIQVVTNAQEFKNLMHRFMSNIDFRTKTGAINAAYVNQNKGATNLVFDHIKTFL